MPTLTLQSLHAREVLDSRGNPTVAVRATLNDGTVAEAMVPSGASTGAHEAVELRDNDASRFGGKGVLQACAFVNGEILSEIAGINVEDQGLVDEALISIDGTPNKSRIGANAALGVSLAIARASALSHGLPLYAYLHSISGISREMQLPVPMMNVINGGKHASNGLTIQEFMVVPKAATFAERVRIGAEIFWNLKTILHDAEYTTAVGDEGGFAPPLARNEDALEMIVQAVNQSGYRLGEQVGLALDVAASEYFQNEQYAFDGSQFSREQFLALYHQWIDQYQLMSIEDGLAEDDWAGWTQMTQQLGDRIHIVGDDLFVTNEERLQRGVEEGVANAILIKPNQIGTLTETFAAVDLAQRNDYTVIISHRSGETEDTTIADLAVAVGAEYIKTGSLSRSERTAKYNRLLAIEEELR